MKNLTKWISVIGCFGLLIFLACTNDTNKQENETERDKTATIDKTPPTEINPSITIVAIKDYLDHVNWEPVSLQLIFSNFESNPKTVSIYKKNRYHGNDVLLATNVSVNNNVVSCSSENLDYWGENYIYVKYNNIISNCVTIYLVSINCYPSNNVAGNIDEAFLSLDLAGYPSSDKMKSHSFDVYNSDGFLQSIQNIIADENGRFNFSISTVNLKEGDHILFIKDNNHDIQSNICELHVFESRILIQNTTEISIGNSFLLGVISLLYCDELPSSIEIYDINKTEPIEIIKPSLKEKTKPKNKKEGLVFACFTTPVSISAKNYEAGEKYQFYAKVGNIKSNIITKTLLAKPDEEGNLTITVTQDEFNKVCKSICDIENLTIKITDGTKKYPELLFDEKMIEDYGCSVQKLHLDFSECTKCEFRNQYYVHDHNSFPPKAFYGNPFLSSVILPEGLKIIQEYAFYNCKQLENINFPNSLTYIYMHAFHNTSLKNEITIGENLVSIGPYAFWGCLIQKINFANKEWKFIKEITNSADLRYRTHEIDINEDNIVSQYGYNITDILCGRIEKYSYLLKDFCFNHKSCNFTQGIKTYYE